MILQSEILHIREKQIEVLQGAVSRVIKESNFRCYQRLIKVNGWPLGYARTFKIIATKKREGKKK